MKNKITNLKISNFKSIKETELECGRINLFVGKPNVGKSNVLEAISLFGVQYNQDRKFMSNFIRYEKLKNLYHFSNTSSPIFINSTIGGVIINHEYTNETNHLYIGPEEAINIQKKENLNIDDFRNKFKNVESPLKTGGMLIQDNGVWQTYSIGDYSPVKKYSFDPKQEISKRERSFLLPPFGNNLFAVLESNLRLKEEIPEIFEEYGFEFLVDIENSSFHLLRRENRIGYTIPYSLIADTLQRIIFHYAAIFSNKDSVILFEEPESHSFPPYIRDLAFKIIESTENQFFITTHSPYLFDTILENTPPEDLALFVTYFENYETKFKKLNDEEIAKIMDYGLEVFFNLNHFVNE